jgi:phage terminase large subunit-like protein
MSNYEPKLDDLDPKEIELLKGAFRHDLDRRRKDDPAEFFPWHRIQEWVFEAPRLFPNPVRIMLMVGGNRSGKSKLAMGLMSRILRRTSPLNEQLLTTDPITGAIRAKSTTDPLRFWIVPPTSEKLREDWINPADGMGIRYWIGDRFVQHRKSPDQVFLAAPPGVNVYEEDGTIDETKCDRLLGKSQDQDLLTFESSEVDIAIFDEEPKDPDIVTSTLMRIATTNGVLIFAFTPLMGLSWSHSLWWKPLIKQGRATKVRDRCWIDAPDDEEMGGIIAVQMGMADNPRARVYAKEVMADPTRAESEKAARVYGEYGFVAGALVPNLAGLDVETPNKAHEIYVVDELPPHERINRWVLMADPNKSYGAILAAVDNDGNVFTVAEHLEQDWPNRRHSEAFNAMCKKWATGPVEEMADPGSAGAQSIIDLNDLGHNFEAVKKGQGSVSRSIKQLRGLAWKDPKHVHPITGELGAPRIYFYRKGLVVPRVENNLIISNPRIAEQISSARQREDSPPDTPDKDSVQKLDLFDCIRYIADVAQVFGGTSENKKPHPLSVDRLTTLHTPEDDVDSSDKNEFYFPEYDF